MKLVTVEFTDDDYNQLRTEALVNDLTVSELIEEIMRVIIEFRYFSEVW